MYFDANWNYVRRFCDGLPAIYRKPKKRSVLSYIRRKPIKVVKFSHPQFRSRLS